MELITLVRQEEEGWIEGNSQKFVSGWGNLKRKWLTFWLFLLRPYRVSSKGGETFQPMRKDSPFSFWP